MSWDSALPLRNVFVGLLTFSPSITIGGIESEIFAPSGHLGLNPSVKPVFHPSNGHLGGITPDQ